MTNVAAATAIDREIKELNVLFPDSAELTIAGKQIRIAPVKFKQTKQLLKLVKGISTVRQANKIMPDELAPDGTSVAQVTDKISSSLTKEEILTLIVDNMEVVTDALAIATGETVDFIDNLDNTDIIRITTAVLKVNYDFFMTQLLPLAQGAMEKFGMTPIMGEAGAS
jgi:hypothetical protein